MNKKLPKVFANKINKKLENNEKVYISSKNIEVKADKTTTNYLNINQKINSIFNSTRYVYKADVIIKTTDETMIKKIIGKNEKNLITIDNELIPIDKIIDIYFKD